MKNLHKHKGLIFAHVCAHTRKKNSRDHLLIAKAQASSSVPESKEDQFVETIRGDGRTYNIDSEISIDGNETGMLKVLGSVNVGLSDPAMKMTVPPTVVLSPIVLIHVQWTLTILEAFQSFQGIGIRLFMASGGSNKAHP
uniref:Uncharacterized protein n=1 Tax=Amphimedon queenslandica TaxID=400682 RepID=A0A1X7VI52_AMPQE